ncbi:MAG TPA: tetratricopeptide repeat protein, partial [Gemmataceae bacterium]|nr:tetratricopeptide repeat protein [Gemmataceae bacterium]
ADHPRVPLYWQDLARSYVNLAGMRNAASRLPEAEKDCLQALQILVKLTAHFPRVPAFRQEQADCHRRLGRVLERTGRLKDGETTYRLAVNMHRAVESELASPLNRGVT